MTDPILLEYWGAANFRGIHHCPICLARKPCPCDQMALEEPAPDPEPEDPVPVHPLATWTERRDVA